MIIGIFIDSISQAFTQLIAHLGGDYERPIYVDLKDNYETTTTKKINDQHENYWSLRLSLFQNVT